MVVGETATIGKNVTLYHGVTLGAFNPTSKRDTDGELVRGTSNKRHPDIEDRRNDLCRRHDFRRRHAHRPPQHYRRKCVADAFCRAV